MDIIAAIATAQGAAGVAIVRLSGENLELTAMNGSELRVKGKIAKVELVR